MPKTKAEKELLQLVSGIAADADARIDKVLSSVRPSAVPSKTKCEPPKPRRSGSKTKAGRDKWKLRVYLGTDQNGKRQNLNKVFYGSAKEADKYLTKLLRERDLGTLVLPDTTTVDEFLDTWLRDAAKPRLSKQTCVSYEYLLKRYVRPSIGQKKLSCIEGKAIARLYAAMTAAGLSARTVRYTHAVLSSAFNQAIKWKLVGINPCKAATLPKSEHREMKAFSQTEARRFLEACKSDKLGLLFAFALESGARPEEYLALTWSDLDFEKRTVTIQRALIRSKEKGGGWYFDKPKTKQSRRTVPMSKEIFERLKDHKADQFFQAELLGSEYESLGLVFANEFGRPLDLKNLRTRNFARILKEAGLDSSFRVYDLRHSMATLMLADGVNPKIVSERLGHASVVLTLDTYCHALPNIQKDASEALAQALYG